MNNQQRAGDSALTLQGKVALITGGGAGIGYAIAEQYVQHGAARGAAGPGPDVAATAQGLDAEHALGLVADVTDRASVEQALADALAHFGRLDVLVNSAGIVALNPAEEVTEAEWDATLAVNLKGVFLTSQAAGRHFIRQRSGSIINLASQAGVVALPNHLAYCASKAGVIGLTQVLALEWGPHNVRVNAISPTVVLTELGRKAWSGEPARQMLDKIPAAPLCRTAGYRRRRAVSGRRRRSND
ncbi:3-oxoacyl-[acyl-carrier-protein] reductase FabG [Serratia rubidaea]|uniref:3-oxoacyl-[acyl-carrier-protein] reductase FabG n=1 Tax=Serratia rubidaea TaxID=61652 RepID=A0A4U9HP70_SERRU|nr:3-oxoacyl-[acyl-carrier-protein] reductase FabG [Serratia rubidaea]